MKMLLRSKYLASTFLLLMALVVASPGLAMEETPVAIENFAMGSQVEKPQPAEERQPLAEPQVLIQMGPVQFDPLHKLPPPKAGIPQIQRFEQDQEGYYIVQFSGPIQSQWKADLTAAGAEVFDYMPEFSFVVRMKGSAVAAVEAMAPVRWVGIFQPSYRLSQAALNSLYTAGGGEGQEVNPVVLRVNLFPGVDLDVVQAGITALGGTIEEQSSTQLKTTLKITLPPARIGDLSAINGVKWIEPVPEWKLTNAVAVDIMTIYPRQNHGLYGQGQTVAVADTGLDQGSTSPANLHDDFENGAGSSRVLQIFDRVAADETGVDQSDVNGHGTHVAGSVLGNGFMSGSNPTGNNFPATSNAGSAPKANLVFQALEHNDTGYLEGIPNDLNQLFSQADTAGAHIHTNSWGADNASQYNSYSADVDEYMWAHRDFLILFSAGNEGADLDGDGIIDPYCIGTPATAKNCLTVGASENDRPSGAGYDTNWATGSWAYLYPANPIQFDHVSDHENGLAAFSSRGPTIDGRYKPDIVAPGTNILSTRTQAVSSSEPLGWGNYDSNYVWMGGTSMSTPLVAGGAALVREYLTTQAGFTTPSAALIKAAMLNGAQDMTPGQYGTGTKREIPAAPVPNNVEGWGRYNLENSVFPPSPRSILYFDETSGLSTGQTLDYNFTVTQSGGPLKVNLAWTDYPATPATYGSLVNDLDLTVIPPSGIADYADHALNYSAVSTISYDNEAMDNALANSYAVRFTPTSYPAYLESVTFFYLNVGSDNDVTVYVLEDNGSGLPDPSSELDRKRLTYLPTGYVTIPFNLTITSGDFHVAVVKSAGNQQGMPVGNGNPYGRTTWSGDSGTTWSVSGYTAIIRASVRYTPGLSTAYDRVNNTVGVSLDSAPAGNYTVQVTGYNVPFGPQPFALVASGNIQQTSGPGDWVTINGTVTYEGTPVNAMVLANGQRTFSDPASGAYSLTVPLDGNGQITIQAGCWGLAPYLQVVDGTSLQNDIAMQAASPGSAFPTVTTTVSTQGTPAGWARINGTITLAGTPLCAIALANGQYMLTCPPNPVGTYDLIVPLDPSGNITLMVFCAGLQFYSATLTP